MDFGPFVTSIIAGTPIAILITLIGLVWQATYARYRDRISDQQTKRELHLEQRKFEHQQGIEELRFAYDQRHWREELGRELTIKLLAERIESHSDLWRLIQTVATSQHKQLAVGDSKALAGKVFDWRYGKGGLLAEDVTRDAAYAFQRALWEYDGSRQAYRTIRRARKLLLRALRADLGLGENASGETIYQIAEQRQSIREDLMKIQRGLNIEIA